MSAPTDRPDDPNLGARGEWLARVSEAASGLAASHTPEQPRGSSSGSTITVSYTSLPPSRDKSLDPTFLFAPPSQLRSRSKLAVCGGLIAIISSVVITAAIAIGEFQPADIWRRSASSYDRACLIVVATGSAKPRTGDSAADRSILARVIGRTHAAWRGVAGTRRGRCRYRQGTGARDGIVSWQCGWHRRLAVARDRSWRCLDRSTGGLCRVNSSRCRTAFVR